MSLSFHFRNWRYFFTLKYGACIWDDLVHPSEHKNMKNVTKTRDEIQWQILFKFFFMNVHTKTKKNRTMENGWKNIGLKKKLPANEIDEHKKQ